MLGYVSVIDALTIHNENRLKKKVIDLTEKQTEIQQIKQKHEKEMEGIRNEMNQQLKQVISLIKRNPKLAQIKSGVLIKRMQNHIGASFCSDKFTTCLCPEPLKFMMI